MQIKKVAVPALTPEDGRADVLSDRVGRLGCKPSTMTCAGPSASSRSPARRLGCCAACADLATLRPPLQTSTPAPGLCQFSLQPVQAFVGGHGLPPFVAVRESVG